MSRMDNARQVESAIAELGQMFGGLMSEMGNALGRSRGNSENETDEDKAGPPPTDEFTDSLKVGMFVDAKDSYGKWYEAAVKEVIPESPNGKRVFIHFFGWSDRFNEWIDVNSGRVQPSYSMIEPWRESLLSPGTMVECKIASGGELSRFLLAIKVVLETVNHRKTIIFDEIDSGIGGAAANAVGVRLAKLGDNYQTMVVTHSPQVTSKGHYHYLVQKNNNNNNITTNVTQLNEKEKIEEIARMVSGSIITNEAREAASKLLDT